MKKIWTNQIAKTDSLVDDYCFSEGAKYDNSLAVFDIYGSIAHGAMLEKIGIITDPEFKKIKKALKKLIQICENGGFKISKEDEDVHTKVEAYLTETLGDLGKKIHTGRSRNDQVLADLRLYAKHELIGMALLMANTVECFVDFADVYKNVPMPGYTHMQKAMPSSVGLWAGSFAEQLLDLSHIVAAAYELINQSPLGTGAAYGVSLPIDREFTAAKLGFSKVQKNSIYTQASRPTFQLYIIQALTQIMLAASRFASDMLLFTTSEFDFFDVSESICTGSSIMPQKKNLDLMEYVRAKTSIMIGNELKTATIASGLPTGYNADFGETKGVFMDSFTITKDTLKVLMLTLNSITPNTDKLKNACTPDLYATHHAYEKVSKGMSFRTAYLEVKQKFNELAAPDPKKFLSASIHTGSTGNLGLAETKKQTAALKKTWNKKAREFAEVISSLID